MEVGRTPGFSLTANCIAAGVLSKEAIFNRSRVGVRDEQGSLTPMPLGKSKDQGKMKRSVCGEGTVLPMPKALQLFAASRERSLFKRSWEIHAIYMQNLPILSVGK
jgi:hypothetical protein